ncbi:alpha/beta hydrolase [Lysobacter brunescens]|uniref:Alpha/beta fold hydrolase n=1 Tax=Lysobacter brunescens TaxID=262323 RepID=A0ABW2YEW4_9GAMM
MIHVIRQIERRLPASQRRRLAPRLLLASALALALGTGVLVATESRAQDAPASAPVNAETLAFDAVREALQVIDAFLAGDTAAVHARFDATMAAAVSAEQLAQGLASIQASAGALQSRGEPTSDLREDGALVTQSLRFERAELVVLVAFDKDRRIAGFALRPPKAPAAEVPPVPADAMYEESEVRIGDAATGLPATLTMPKGKGPFPAVVLVHGSGPQDRHSTIGPNRPFLDIARGLAERGIAVLRYEKRTKAQPQAFMDGGATIDRETTDDALLAVQTLRALPGVNAKRVFVLGHSLGGMMAPRIAQRDPKIAGIVLLAAPSRPLLDILIEQNKRLAVLDDGRISEQENAAIMRLSDSVKAVRDGREMTAAQGPLGLSPEYWRTVEAVDPVAEAARIKQPMLILQGARDIQVVDADWQNWREAFHDDARVTFKLYESLNHLAIPGEGDGSLAEYTRPGQVAPELIADVAAWIKAPKATAAPKTDR